MERPRATPPLLRHLNEQRVLETIRTGAPISRAEISRRAGISKPTVSLALERLLEAELVREAENETGRPSYGAICDLNGDIRARKDVEVSGLDAPAALEAIVELKASLVSSTDLDSDLIDT